METGAEDGTGETNAQNIADKRTGKTPEVKHMTQRLNTCLTHCLHVTTLVSEETNL